MKKLLCLMLIILNTTPLLPMQEQKVQQKKLDTKEQILITSIKGLNQAFEKINTYLDKKEAITKYISEAYQIIPKAIKELYKNIYFSTAVSEKEALQLRADIEKLYLEAIKDTNISNKDNLKNIQNTVYQKIQKLAVLYDTIKKSKTIAREKRFAVALLSRYARHLIEVIDSLLNPAPQKPLPQIPQPALVTIPESKELFPEDTNLFSDSAMEEINQLLDERLRKQKETENRQRRDKEIIQQPAVPSREERIPHSISATDTSSQQLAIAEPQTPGINWLTEAQIASDKAQEIKDTIKKHLTGNNGPNAQEAAKRAMTLIEKIKENNRLAKQSPQNALYFGQLAKQTIIEIEKLEKAAHTLAKDYQEKLQAEEKIILGRIKSLREELQNAKNHDQEFAAKQSIEYIEKELKRIQDLLRRIKTQ